MPTSISESVVLLAEGFDPTLMPDVAYVVQGEKLWFAPGLSSGARERILGESQEATIVESYEDLDLIEKTVGNKTVRIPKGGIFVVEGPFQRSDVKNANKRYYPRAIWERIIGDAKSAVQANIRSRAMIGHLEHPKDGRTDGREGALVVTEARLDDDGTVWGKAELLDTPNGLIVQEYVRRGVRWGVSSRGTGRVDDTGRVQEDSYQLDTWDAVMRPSTPGAFPQPEGSPAVREETTPPALSEDDQARLSEICALQRRAEEDLDEAILFDSLEFLHQVLAQTQTGTVIPQQEVEQAQQWLTAKLRELSGADPITRTIHEATTRDDDAVDAAIERLELRLQETAEESSALIRELETAEADLCEVTARLTDTEQQLAEVRAESADLGERLALATDLLTPMPMEESISELVEQIPSLHKVEKILALARDEDALKELAEVLIPLVEPPPPPPPVRREEPRESTTQPLQRRALPVGVIVESDRDAAKPVRVRPSGEISEGVRMAALVLSHLEQHK
jgi:hypothetical protein